MAQKGGKKGWQPHGCAVPPTWSMWHLGPAASNHGSGCPADGASSARWYLGCSSVRGRVHPVSAEQSPPRLGIDGWHANRNHSLHQCGWAGAMEGEEENTSPQFSKEWQRIRSSEVFNSFWNQAMNTLKRIWAEIAGPVQSHTGNYWKIRIAPYSSAVCSAHVSKKASGSL